MKFIVIAAIAASIAAAPVAQADPVDKAIGNDPGLQQACAFNPAFNKRHAGACADYTIEAVASNCGGCNSHYDPPKPKAVAKP